MSSRTQPTIVVITSTHQDPLELPFLLNGQSKLATIRVTEARPHVLVPASVADTLSGLTVPVIFPQLDLPEIPAGTPLVDLRDVAQRLEEEWSAIAANFFRGLSERYQCPCLLGLELGTYEIVSLE